MKLLQWKYTLLKILKIAICISVQKNNYYEFNNVSAIFCTERIFSATQLCLENASGSKQIDEGKPMICICCRTLYQIRLFGCFVQYISVLT